MSLLHPNPDGISRLILAAMLKNLAVANVLAVALGDQVHVRGSTASVWKVGFSLQTFLVPDLPSDLGWKKQVISELWPEQWSLCDDFLVSVTSLLTDRSK